MRFRSRGRESARRRVAAGRQFLRIPRPHVVGAPAPRLTLAGLFAGVARGVAEAQGALDQAARASLVLWERDGIPPCAWTWSRSRLRASVAFGCVAVPRDAAPTALAHAELTVAPRHGGRAAACFALRYVPAPLDGGA